MVKLDESNIEICDSDLKAALERALDKDGNALFRSVKFSSHVDTQKPSVFPSIIIERKIVTRTRTVQNFGYNYRVQYNLYIFNTTNTGGDPEAELIRLVTAASLYTRTPDINDVPLKRGLVPSKGNDNVDVWWFEPSRNELQEGSYVSQYPIQKTFAQIEADHFQCWMHPLPLIYCRFYDVPRPITAGVFA